MSSFTPTLRIRPEPQKTSTVLANRFKQLVPPCVIVTVVGFLADPYFRKLHAAWPYDDCYLFGVISFVIHEALYLGFNTILYYGMKKGGFLEKYRIDRGSLNGDPPAELVRRTLIENLPGHLIVQPLLATYVLFPAMKHYGADFKAPLPSSISTFFLLVASWFVLDITFYWAHRLFHHEKMYRFHKQHHEYKHSVAYAAEYASLPEHMIANTLPTILLPTLAGMHPHVWFIWLTWRLLETYVAHSGIDLPWAVSSGSASHAQYHDFHHSRNYGNFGSDFTDHLFGTQDAWLQHLSERKATKQQ